MDHIFDDKNNAGVVKIRIEAVGGDLDRIACRYPTSFMNEMASQLTSAIEDACGVLGLADSSVTLVMMFASSTYMEHISGNVTYRRLMLIDAVSAPRDFWIKWTRLDSSENSFTDENILFELGEDVEQTILQREYKYLLNSGKEKYHNSMSRKKVTEWREVIKRAAKRGELEKPESDYELAPETLELEERIADLLGKKLEHKAEIKAESPSAMPENDEFSLAMEKARMVVEDSSDEENESVTLADIADEIIERSEEQKEIPLISEGDDEGEIIEAESEELDFTDVEADEDEPFTEEELLEEYEEEPEDIAEELETEFEEELEIEPEDEPDEDDGEFDIFADGEADEAEEIDIFEDEPQENGELGEEDVAEEFVIEDESGEEFVIESEPDEIEEDPSELEIEMAEDDDDAFVFEIGNEPEEKAAEEIEKTSEELPEEAHSPEPVIEKGDSIADRIADIRAELEIKIRLEYETRMRLKAEEEITELRRQMQMSKSEKDEVISDLIKENERLRVEYEHLLTQTHRDSMAREAEAARRREEEEQLRSEIERQLRAEADERERLADEARAAIEEQRRLEEENARIARQREEAERIKEAERQRKIEQEKAIEDVRKAELERIRLEQEKQMKRAKEAMPNMQGGYTYTSKTVKLIFRKNVDPNITTRIYEIIKATVDYYGKDNVYLKIRATVFDSQTVVLEFTNIPLEEMQLLGNIIKILGNSGLGIAKAIIN